MEENERKFCELAVEEAKKSIFENDGKPHPYVGVVIVKDGKILATAHRGEIDPGDHAEYTALEKKLGGELISGATIYTTLEPCVDRHKPKIPCVYRLIERKVERVVIGMVDPDPRNCGKGQRILTDANIKHDLFPDDIVKRIEELNREFNRYVRSYSNQITVNEEFIEKCRVRSLNEWYYSINRIYWNRNFDRDVSAIFTHLIEVFGGLSVLASEKNKPGINPEKYLAKTLAWWFALCGKLGVSDIEQLIWDKFPDVCAYCRQPTHKESICEEEKKKDPSPSWRDLQTIGETKRKPENLSKWQEMFSRVYPVQQTETFAPSFARLTEEVGELAETIRVFRANPGYFRSEAADVFAWLMHIQNIYDKKYYPEKKFTAIYKNLALAYPDRCIDCGNKVCTCPPILGSTINRLSHDVPKDFSIFGKPGRFLTPDGIKELFQVSE